MTTTSISFHLRPSQAEGRHPGKLFIRIIRARRSRHIPRNYSVYAEEWDTENKRIVPPPAGGDSDRTSEIDPGNAARSNGSGSGIKATRATSERIHVLSHIDGSMKSDLKRLREIVARLEEQGDYTASDVVARFTESLGGDTVRGYAGIASSRLREQGRERTARAYRSAARSLTNFNGGEDVLLSEIDAVLMAGYERHLLGRGLKLNTVSFYLRNIRSLYYRAVAEKLIPRQEVNPFAGMHTGVYETRRRALDNDQLKALASLEISLQEQLEALERAEVVDSDRTVCERAAGRPDGEGTGRKSGLPGGDKASECAATGESSRISSESLDACSGFSSAERIVANSGQSACERKKMEEWHKISALHDSLLLFLFCYHARGMSFVDMAHLKQEDVGAETLTYRRRKTGGLLEVAVTEPMRRILSHFASRTRHSGYVFPVIDPSRGNTWRQYETGLKRQNRLLKTLAAMAGIEENLSTHAARHTWATLAKRMQVPVAVIGEALGHRDVKTTSIYLASFDRATMDELSARLSEAAKAA